MEIKVSTLEPRLKFIKELHPKEPKQYYLAYLQNLKSREFELSLDHLHRFFDIFGHSQPQEDSGS